VRLLAGAMSVDPGALERSVGVRVELRFEPSINPFVWRAHEHRTFFSRLHYVMIVSNAFVVAPEGIGTLLEMSPVPQPLQVRKLYATPLILVGKMWAELVEWGRRSMLEAWLRAQAALTESARALQRETHERP